MRKRVAVLILGVQLAVVPACAGDDAARPTSSRPKTIDCGPGYLGPWTLCPEAAWTRRIVEEAGYNIIGNTGSALLAAGRGYEYSIWTTPLDRPPRELAEKEGWKLLARVRSVGVFGDAELWRWWAAQGYVVWVHAGRRETSRSPPPDELGPLISQSQTLPPPP